MSRRCTGLPAILLVAVAQSVSRCSLAAFVAPANNRRTSSWQTRTPPMFLVKDSAAQKILKEQPLQLLPFVETEILLPGQSREVVVKEGRHFDMVDQVLEEGSDGMLGQIAMGPDGLLEVVSLCQIFHTEVHSGYRGKVTMTVGLRSVGRAQLVELLQLKPIPCGNCRSLVDQDIDNQGEEATRLVQELELLLTELDSLTPEGNKEAKGGTTMRFTQVSPRKSFRAAYDESKELLCGDGVHTQPNLEAASWAVFGALSQEPQSYDPYHALQSACLLDRLEHAKKCTHQLRDTKHRQMQQYSLDEDGSFE